MTPEMLESLGTNIDDAFFLFAGLIFLIELAEGFFKGKLSGKSFLEMIASASTQIPYLLVEAFILTGAYTAFYLFAYSNISWMMPLMWWTIALAVLVADSTQKRSVPLTYNPIIKPIQNRACKASIST